VPGQALIIRVNSDLFEYLLVQVILAHLISQLAERVEKERDSPFFRIAAGTQPNRLRYRVPRLEKKRGPEIPNTGRTNETRYKLFDAEPQSSRRKRHAFPYASFLGRAGVKWNGRK